MKKIFKYPIELAAIQTVELPKGAEILSVQFQREDLCLWAKVTEEAPRQNRTIVIYGTGHAIAEDAGDKFIATVQQHGGNFVWHVFERQK